MDTSIGQSQEVGMRTLLRHMPTGLYVQSEGSWTGNLEDAYDFKTLSHAIRFVEQAGLRRMELAFVSSHLCRLTEVPLEMLSWGPSVSKRYDKAA